LVKAAALKLYNKTNPSKEDKELAEAITAQI